MEIWKDCVNYEDYFMVSNLGNVWSKRTNKILSPTKSKTGYLYICTKFGGRLGEYKSIRLHRMVAMTFLDNPNNFPIINHIDGNKQNNCVDNLEWCTYSHNTLHAIKLGRLKVRGEESKSSKLTTKQVYEILSLLKSGLRQQDIANMYGVARKAICKISTGKSWAHLIR